jgi:hypothetical protein
MANNGKDCQIKALKDLLEKIHQEKTIAQDTIYVLMQKIKILEGENYKWRKYFRELRNMEKLS